MKTALLLAALLGVGSMAAAQDWPVSQDNPVTRRALMALFTNTHGDGWAKSSGWGSNSVSYCTWEGLKCPMHTPGNVLTDIILSNNNLTGTIPVELNTIVTLKNLDLSFNSISGTVPDDLGNIVPLQTVVLNDNKLEGPLPRNLCNVTTNWPSLKTINLFNNRITGTIPEGLFGPATLPVFHPRYNLQVLDLHNNMLTGTLPTRVTRADRMGAFLVNENRMSGGVPATMVDWLVGVKYCSMGGNAWACPVPANVTANCQAYCKSA